MVDFNNSDCTGCGACEQTCPQHCITMTPNRDGFLYPLIDQSLCSKCNLCEKRCPIYAESKTDIAKSEVYAAILKDKEVLLQSSSGGAFSAIADCVIEKGGTVFGCALNEKLEAVHIGVKNKQSLAKLRGSKYVQSDMRDTFFKAKQELDRGQQVLFTGTPCQIAGLKAYLNKEYNNLITADLICHGVPSPTFFKAYITWLGKKLHSEISEYKFRDKSKVGWGSQGKVFYKNISKTISCPSDPYYYLFYNGIVCRACCYVCKYANTIREGDFTIGDFWGIEKYYPRLKADAGVSLIMINTPVGGAVFNDISDKILFIESTIDNACAQNMQLNQPIVGSVLRKEIFGLFNEQGFDAVVKKFYSLSRKERVKSSIKKIIPKRVKTFIKNRAYVYMSK